MKPGTVHQRNRGRHGDQKPIPFPLRKSQNHLLHINRQLSQLSHRKNEMIYGDGAPSRDQRKARVRRLIQLGELVEKSGLLKLVELQEGQDLQKDFVTIEGMVKLRGALIFLKESLLSKEAEDQKILWQKRAERE